LAKSLVSPIEVIIVLLISSMIPLVPARLSMVSAQVENVVIPMEPGQTQSFSLGATNPETFAVQLSAYAYPANTYCETFQGTGSDMGCPKLVSGTKWLPSNWIEPSMVSFGYLPPKVPGYDPPSVTVNGAFSIEIPANAERGDYSLGWTWYGKGGNSPPYDHWLHSEVWIVHVSDEHLLKTDSVRYKVWGYIGMQVTIGSRDKFSWNFQLTPTANYLTDSFFVMLLNGRSASGKEGPVWFEIYLNGAKVSSQVVYLHASGPTSLIMDINSFIQPFTSYTLEIYNRGDIPAYFESIEYLAMTCTTTTGCG
jgi:hypothetical protein